VRSVHVGPILGLTALLVLLRAILATVGLGGIGWVAGVACAVAVVAVLSRSLVRHGLDRLGPAGRVTLTRAMLVCAVAALVADSFAGDASATPLVALTVVALVLDAVDGWVARRTATASALGARFDMEIDAFLILVLSVYATHAYGAWVLGIGAARYAFAVAGWLGTWLRAPVPARYWRKVVAAIQGIVLAVAAADVAPRRLTEAALVAALLLLAESFGRDVWWLWCTRPAMAAVELFRGRRAMIGTTRWH
jgi:phosphatidylglycerophosphate synthase